MRVKGNFKGFYISTSLQISVTVWFFFSCNFKILLKQFESSVLKDKNNFSSIKFV